MLELQTNQFLARAALPFSWDQRATLTLLAPLLTRTVVDLSEPSILLGLRTFAGIVLDNRKPVVKPLQISSEKSVETGLMNLPVVLCHNKDREHQKTLLQQIAKKFMTPLLTNYAADVTDQQGSEASGAKAIVPDGVQFAGHFCVVAVIRTFLCG